MEYLVFTFKEKVKKVFLLKKGETVMYFNNNMGGRGYMFNEEEQKKANDYKNIFKH